jgi:geranylgeranyl diphosphate synthase type I
MSEDAFGQFIARTRAQVDAWLATWLGARVAAAHARGPEVEAVATALSDLVLRGGKRLRAGLLAASYEACGGQGGGQAVVAAGGAVELLQGYLLAHDDWMDGDEVRRGGPSVPAMMRARFPGHADEASVLAGDLGAAWALDALTSLPLAPTRVLAAAREMARVHEDVVQGQVLDVLGQAGEALEVETLHALKTASYTVRGPVVMGARLAGGDAQAGALAAYAEPLGVAFQLRDDMLGTFGDTRAMGKPAGGDLRSGKRTSLVLEAMRDATAASALGRVLGKRDASDSEVAMAVEAIEASGARAHVEARIGALVAESRAALARAELVSDEGRALLEGAVVALTERER